MKPRSKRVTPGNPLLAVAYYRVSREHQLLGIDAQRAQVAAWAARNGVTIVSEHEDPGVSGATPLDKRTGMLDALASIQAHGAGVLIAAKLDRLARDAFVAVTIEKAVESFGAVVRTADGASNSDTPEGILMRQIGHAFAAYERACIKARTAAALAVKKGRNERIGTLPYGQQLAEDGLHLVAEDAERATIEAARALHAQGLSVRAVASELASRGVVGRTGRPLSHTQIHRLVRAA